MHSFDKNLQRPELVQTIIELIANAESEKRAATLLVHGVPGIGKTTLIDQVVNAKSGTAFFMLGRTNTFDKNVPFSVIRDALLRISDLNLPVSVKAKLADAIEKLDFNKWESKNDRGQTIRLDQVLAGLGEFFQQLCSDAKVPAVVLILEDLHDADPDSIAVLATLSRQFQSLPLLVWGTIRTGAANYQLLSRAIQQLGDTESGFMLEIPPLANLEVFQLTQKILNAAPTEPFLLELAAASKNVPFMLVKYLESLQRSNLLQYSENYVGQKIGVFDFDWDNPAGFLHHLLPMETDSSKVASGIAVFNKFSDQHLELLAELLTMEFITVTKCIDQLTSMKLIIRDGDNYIFAHPLLKSAAIAALGNAQRRQLHAKIIVWMDAIRDDGKSIDPFEYATHLLEANQKAALLPAALTAASLANQSAPLVAAHWFQIAADVAPAELRPQLFHAQSMSLQVGSDTVGSVRAGKAALAETPPGPDRDEVVFVTTAALLANAEIGQAFKIATEERKLNPENRAIQIGTYYLQAITRDHKFVNSDYHIAAELGDFPRGTPLVRATNYAELFVLAGLFGHFQDRSYFREQARAHIAPSSPLLAAEVINFLSTQPGLVAGDLTEALAGIKEADGLRGSRVMLSSCGNSEISIVQSNWLAGNWAEACKTARDSYPAQELGGTFTAAQIMRSLLVLMLTDQGKHAEALQIAKGLNSEIELYRSQATVALARVARLNGETSLALELLWQRWQEHLELGITWLATFVAEELIHELLLQEKFDQARQVANQALDFAVANPAPSLLVWAYRGIATISRDYFVAKQALEISIREGYVFETGKCLLLVVELASSDAKVTIKAHLTQALEIFTTLEATSWVRRTHLLMRHHGLRVSSEPSAADLSQTEQELIQLVCQGLTNREIAVAMGLALKTVEIYLSRIYQKLDCHNRNALKAKYGAAI